MKKANRQDMIYQLALAGISAALAIVFVTLGVYLRFTTVAFFIAAGLAVMIPLCKRYWFAAVAALVASGVASFFIAGSDITAVAGFIVYFGPMALISGIMYNLHAKWWVQLPIKLAYINGALALLYYALGTIVVDPAVMQALPYWAIAIIGSVLLLAVDVLQVFIYSKLIVIVGRVLRTASKGKAVTDENTERPTDEEPFEEELFETDIYPKESEKPSESENSGDEDDGKAG